MQGKPMVRKELLALNVLIQGLNQMINALQSTMMRVYGFAIIVAGKGV